MARHSSCTKEEDSWIWAHASEEIRLERDRKRMLDSLMRHHSRPSILAKLRYYREILKYSETDDPFIVKTEGPNA